MGDRIGPLKSWGFRPSPCGSSGQQCDPFISSGSAYRAPSFSWALDEPVDNGTLYSGGRCYISTITNAAESTTSGGSTAVAIGFILKPAGAAVVEVLLTQLAATGFGAMAAASTDDAAGGHTVVGKALTMEIFRVILYFSSASLQRNVSQRYRVAQVNVRRDVRPP